LLAKVGGLFSLMNVFFRALAEYINLEAILASVAKKTYFKDLNGTSLRSLTVDWWEWATLFVPFKS
jgi:hypothetical protein